MFLIFSLFASDYLLEHLTSQDILAKQKMATFAEKVLIFINNVDVQSNEDVFKAELSALDATQEDTTRILAMDRASFFNMLKSFYYGFYNNVRHELGHALTAAAMHQVYDIDVKSLVVFDRDTLITNLTEMLNQQLDNNVGKMVGYNLRVYGDKDDKRLFVHLFDSLAGLVAEYRSNDFNDKELQNVIIASLKDLGLFFASYVASGKKTDEKMFTDILCISYLIDEILKENKELYDRMTLTSLKQGYVLNDQLNLFYQDLKIPLSINAFLKTNDASAFVKDDLGFNRFLRLVYGVVSNTEFMLKVLQSY